MSGHPIGMPSSAQAMRIAVFLPSDFEDRPTGGMLTAVKNFLKSTRGYPFSITLFGLCWKPDEKVGGVYSRNIHGATYPFIPLCRLTEMEVNGHRPLVPLRAKMFWSCLLNRRLVSERSFDVLYFHAPELFPLMPAQNADIVYHAHGTEEWGAQYSRYRMCRTSAFQRLYRVMINRIGACADQFVCIDRECYNVYRARWPARAQDIHLVWGSVDTEVFKPAVSDVRARTRAGYGVSDSTGVLLFVGRLTQLKGVHLIVDAVARLRRANHNLVLWVIGNGEEEAALRKQIDAAGLEAGIRLLGRVAHESLPELYNSADLTIVASEQESLCFTILESLACGTPVVSTRVGVAPHVIQDGRSGILLKARTVEELVRSIEAGLALPRDSRQAALEAAGALNNSSNSICELIMTRGRIKQAAGSRNHRRNQDGHGAEI